MPDNNTTTPKLDISDTLSGGLKLPSVTGIKTTTPAVVTSDLAREQLEKDNNELDTALKTVNYTPLSATKQSNYTPLTYGPFKETGVIDNKTAVNTAIKSEAVAKTTLDTATKAKEAIKETGTPDEIAEAEKAVIEATKTVEKTSQINKLLSEGGVAMNEETARKLFGKDFTGVHLNPDGTFVADKTAMSRIGGTTDVETVEDTRSPAQIEAEKGVKQTQSELDALQTRIDSRSASLIEGIKEEYAELIKQQQSFNKSYEGGVFVEGVRSGRERYAHVHQLGIVKQSIDDGVSKIASLINKKNKLIMEAETARDEGSFKLLAEKMKGYRDTIKEEREASQQLFDNIIKQGKETRDQMKDDREEAKLAFDQAITTLETIGPAIADMATSITDPDELQTFLENTAINMKIPTAMLAGEIKKIQNKSKEQITKTVLDLSTKYPDARISANDSLDVAQEKLLKSPSYRRDVAKEQAELAREDRGGTVQEREIVAVSKFSNAFVPEAKLDGVPIIGPDGFADPAAWKRAAADAPTEGLTRKRFIQEFGYLVNVGDEEVLKKYGLTPSELKTIIVEL